MTLNVPADGRALLGLPIIGAWPEEVFILSGRATGSRQGQLVRVGTRDDPLLIGNGDLRMTSVPYSLIQLARHARLGAAVVAADAALCDLPYGPPSNPSTTLTELMALHRLLPYPRSNRVRAMLDRVTHLSASGSGIGQPTGYGGVRARQTTTPGAAAPRPAPG